MTGSNTLINWIHILIVGPLLLIVGLGKKSNPTALFHTLVVVGVVVVLYHLYRLIMTYKKEGFMRSNNYYWMHHEGFTPFSHPYTCESSAYYSYHDPTHSRKCPCDMTGDKAGVCDNQNLPGDATDVVPTRAGGVAASNLQKPSVYSDYGMRTVAPVSGKNPNPSDYLL